MSATNSPRLNFQRNAAHGVHFHFASAISLVHVIEFDDDAIAFVRFHERVLLLRVRNGVHRRRMDSSQPDSVSLRQ